MIGTWVRTVKASKGVPVGITGQVFWSGPNKFGPGLRIGVDLNGENARIFVDAAACITFDPADEVPGVQRKMFGANICQGCEMCDGEGGHVVQARPVCDRCKQTLCSDGCCGCICGEPSFEK